MKLKNPFSVFKSSLRDIQVMHDFNYNILTKTREDFPKNRYDQHKTKSTYKTVEV